MEQRLELTAHKDGTVSELLQKQLHLSRHQISRLKFTFRGLLCKGKPIRTVDPVTAGTVISVLLYEKQEALCPCPYPILYEDRWVIVIDKPAGAVVHPSPGHESDSIQTVLEAWCGCPLHICGRLDKDTSGCLLFSKVDWLAGKLQPKKTYLAWIEGTIQPGTISLPLALHDRKMAADPRGKPARTHIEKAQPCGSRSLLTITLSTGRMHQIRAHLAALGHPLVHDPIYGQGQGRALLHCVLLQFSLPQETIEVRAPLPDDMKYNQTIKEDV